MVSGTVHRFDRRRTARRDRRRRARSLGNTFEAVTDERGGFRLPVQVGDVPRMTLQLPGFATVARSGLELLVGQQGGV